MADETFRAAIAAAIALEPEGGATVVIEAEASFDAEAAVSKAEAVGKAWVIEIPGVGAVLEQLAKREDVSVFHLDEIPGSLFATTERLAVGKSSVLVAGGQIGIVVTDKAEWTTAYINDLPDSAFLFIEADGEKDDGGKTKPRSQRHFPVKDSSGAPDPAHLRNAIARIPQSTAPGLDEAKKTSLQESARKMLAALEKSESVEKRFSKVLKTAEERYVLGVVLVPETKDSQGDIYSHAEVRKAAHAYMETAGNLGKQHSELVTGKLKILENYIAPVDFEQDGEAVAKGTWLLGIRVVDDALWSDVKKGDFTGFSIGGDAYRSPEKIS